MTLKGKLKEIFNNYSDEVEEIKDFISFTNQSMEKKLKIIRKIKLDPEEKDEFTNLMDNLDKFISYERPDDSKIELKSNKVVRILIGVLTTIKHKDLFADMSLSYLLSYLEAFIKDYLYIVYVYRKDYLKCDKKMSFEEISSFTSIKSVINHMAQKEVDTLGYGSIDDYEKYFTAKFNIVFSDFSKWDKIRESSYRRNIIIHNRGITNSVYCEKTGFNKTNIKLKTDLKYIRNIIDVLLEFFIFFHKSMLTKLKLE